MTKAELIENVQKSLSQELSKRIVAEIIESTFDNIARAIKKDKRFVYPGFGTFTIRKRKARTGRNPQTGAEIRIPASKTIGFKPAPSLKSEL
jgi:DNA-binding protein HU-beta